MCQKYHACIEKVTWSRSLLIMTFLLKRVTVSDSELYILEVYQTKAHNLLPPHPFTLRVLANIAHSSDLSSNRPVRRISKRHTASDKWQTRLPKGFIQNHRFLWRPIATNTAHVRRLFRASTNTSPPATISTLNSCNINHTKRARTSY